MELYSCHTRIDCFVLMLLSAQVRRQECLLLHPAAILWDGAYIFVCQRCSLNICAPGKCNLHRADTSRVFQLSWITPWMVAFLLPEIGLCRHFIPSRFWNDFCYFPCLDRFIFGWVKRMQLSHNQTCSLIHGNTKDWSFLLTWDDNNE